MDLRVLVEPSLPSMVADAISFECGASLKQATENTYVYEHHGEDFTPEHQGALSRFFEDMMLGARFPTTFATRAIRDVDTMFAIALFLNRDLALVPGMIGLVAQVELVHRRGVPMFGHLDPSTVSFLRLLREYLPESLTKSEMRDRIQTAAGWIRELATNGSYPPGRPLPEVRLIDRGTNAFVVAETEGDLVEGWVVLYSMGYIRGVLVRPERGGRREVLAARKSLHAPLDLPTAARLLNDVESVMGEPAEWSCKGDWLFGPAKGTVLTLPHMLEVFLRV